MLGNLLGGLIDKEKVTFDMLQSTLEDLAIEMNCSHKEFFVMIKPSNETFDPKGWVYKNNEKGTPVLVREITIKEIISEDDAE